MSAVIEVEGLRKTYWKLRRGKTAALDGLDLSVPQGGVFGFLGPNGSGKTTAIRVMLGLVRPSGGKALLFGKPVPRTLPTGIRNVGAVVETPALFPTFSGRKNLILLARIDGIGAKRVDQVLEDVGLAERGRDIVKTYSLGMRQRLGIAAALLKDPELLILDEPANGLDPAGIRDIRSLMRWLADEGRTVFVSSHILSEIEHTCDSVAILAHGRCVTSGTVADVLKAGSKASGLIVKLADLEAGFGALVNAGLSVTRDRSQLIVDAHPTRAAQITELLGRQNLWISEIQPRVANLEDVFLDLIGESQKVGKPTDQWTGVGR